ncbi:MAG TPA: PadR family transcriptional regulator [Mycobacteriales bacterium]|nr:PadR family transcriptional regulator [Mycobacteriales bacterium]
MHPTDSGRWRPHPHEHPRRHPPFGRPGAFGPGGFGRPGGFGGPGPFGPGGGRGRHRGRGARRGDVRAAVLALLAERPMHGYEIIQQIEERSGGVWRPSPGSVYPTLQLLADEGLVSGDESGGRRLFTLTDSGRTEAERLAGSAPWQQEPDESWATARRFRDELGQLGMAVWQVARVGTDEQRAEVLAALAEARRKAYRLLADSDTDTETDTER